MKTSCMKCFLNFQRIWIKFALKLFVCKCLSFQTHLLLELGFLLISILQWVCACVHDNDKTEVNLAHVLKFTKPEGSF